jgi:drug/metabolite transporter (DMT)-like permease
MTTASKGDGLIVCCAVSAGVHAALVPEHLRERLVTGAGFAAATLALVAAMIGLTVRPDSRAITATAVGVLMSLVVGYVVASTDGIPFLHPDVDPIDTLGILTKAVEIVGVGLGTQLLHGALERPEGART